jgi:hypothetical protein
MLFNFVLPTLLGAALYQFITRALESNNPIEAVIH